MYPTRIPYPHLNSSILRSSRLGLAWGDRLQITHVQGDRPAQAKSWALRSLLTPLTQCDHICRMLEVQILGASLGIANMRDNRSY